MSTQTKPREQLLTQLRAMALPPGFDAQAWLDDWLVHPVPALGGRRPVDVLAEPDGLRVVSTVLARMESGSVQLMPTATEALREAYAGGALLALVAMRQSDDELLLALDKEPEMLAKVERAAKRRLQFSGLLRGALVRLEMLRGERC